MTDIGPLRDFLIKLLATHEDHTPFEDEESLIGAGRLDSVDVMDIVFFLEDNYQIDLSSGEINAADFDSLAAIARNFLEGGRT